MNIYKEWGFSENPFCTLPLSPDSDGEALLVDRKQEIRKIKLRLSSSSNLITVEGNNGVSKTSLINVATYELYRDYLITGDGAFFMPCDTQFQLTTGKDPQGFIDEVLMDIGQTLIRRGGQALKNKGYKLDGNKSVDRWLNSAQISSHSGGVNIMNFGGAYGNTSETNTSQGYLRSGFRKKILDWLSEIFPLAGHGELCVY